MRRTDSTSGKLMYGGPGRAQPNKYKEPLLNKVVFDEHFTDIGHAAKKGLKGMYGGVVGAVKYLDKVEHQRNVRMQEQGKAFRLKESLKAAGVGKHARSIAESAVKAEKRKMPRT